MPIPGFVGCRPGKQRVSAGQPACLGVPPVGRAHQEETAPRRDNLRQRLVRYRCKRCCACTTFEKRRAIGCRMAGPRRPYQWGALKCVRCKYGGLKARGPNCAVPCWCCFKCECLKCSGTECGGHECGSIKCGCFNARILSATGASMPRVQCVSHLCACPKWSGEVFEFPWNGRAAF